MTKRLYESAETLVYDPVAANRNATRASLHSLGFRRVEMAVDLDSLEARLRERAPDLLFAEVAGAESEVCQLIQNIRQCLIGNNPFIVVMATTWRRDGAIVQQVVNSGADDLVARPVSTAVLGDRIRAQVERRKGFVVTSHYVGPDRRHGARCSTVQCVDVPNPLQLKTLEGLDREELERRIAGEIGRGRDMLNSEKMRRDTMQLCGNWRLLEQRSPRVGDFFDIVARMDKLAGEIKRRATGTGHGAAVELCESICGTIVAITAAAEKADAEGRESGIDFGPTLHVLGHAVLRLGQILAPDEMQPAPLAHAADEAAIDMSPAADSRAA